MENNRNLVAWTAGDLTILGVLIGLDAQDQYLLAAWSLGQAHVLRIPPDQLNLNPQAEGYVTTLVA